MNHWKIKTSCVDATIKCIVIWRNQGSIIHIDFYNSPDEVRRLMKFSNATQHSFLDNIKYVTHKVQMYKMLGRHKTVNETTDWDMYNFLQHANIY